MSILLRCQWHNFMDLPSLDYSSGCVQPDHAAQPSGSWLIQITIKARKSCHRRGLFIPMLGWITSDSMHIRREMISPQFPDLLLPYHTLRSKFSLIIFYFLGNLDPTVFSEVNRAWQQDDGISTALILSAAPNRIRQHPTKWPVTTNLSNSR